VSLPNYDTISHGNHEIIPLISGTGSYSGYKWTWIGNGSPIIGSDSGRTVTINIGGVKVINTSTGDLGTLMFTGITADGCAEWDTAKFRLAPPLKPWDVCTPNGDGKNDFWYIPNADLYPDMLVQVFSRWGEEVFSQKGYDNDTKVWRGNFKGKTVPVGTYYYMITIPNERVTKGTITIMK
jgi:gliding motility-associated-like protein